MKLKNLVKELNFALNEKELDYLKKESDNFSEQLKKIILKKKINADVFIGGSLAKGTIAQTNEYDVDIFVRFDWKYENLTWELEKIVKGLGGEKVHGSRDYFRINKGGKLTFEIIPVLRIMKPNEARNVTDLSYFHVNYVKNKFTRQMTKELALMKKFCKAQKVYGAETYINGFSGYSLECLIIYYKTFEKMLRSLVKIKIGERIIIDPARHYEKKDEVLIEMNESKIQGPIILVDPTWKERNVLAALNRETFERFQSKAREFLSNPEKKFFEIKKINIEKIKSAARVSKTEFLHISLETDRQEGDIAGTKMKKFAKFLALELGEYFYVLKKVFDYIGVGKKANFYLVVKPKREIVRVGPPKKFERAVKKFKAANKNVFEKNGYLHTRIKVDFSAGVFLKKWKKENSKKISEMGITKISI